MLPMPKSGALLTSRRRADYAVGDVVFCKAKGRYIDAHKVAASDATKGCLVAHNHSFENGWTKRVFGRAGFGGHAKKL